MGTITIASTFILYNITLPFSAIACTYTAFQIGRMGTAQFSYFISKTPTPRETYKDDIKLALTLADIPTSIGDILANFLGLNIIKTISDVLNYYATHWAATIFHYLSITGMKIARLAVWFFIPLSIVLSFFSSQSAEYWPGYLTDLSINSPFKLFLASLAIETIAILAGTLIGSPQKRFNIARQRYESIVIERGYWFNHHTNPHHYVSHAAKLEQTKKEFAQTLQEISSKSSFITQQQIMTLLYQVALLQATMSNYPAASEALQKCRQIKESQISKEIWENNEEREFESKITFLEAELAYVNGDLDTSKTLFLKSKNLDVSLRDNQGIHVNNERLNLFQSVEEILS